MTRSGASPGRAWFIASRDGFVILSRTAAHVAALLDPESDPVSPNRRSPGRAATERHPVNRYDRRPRLFPRRRRWLTYDAH